MRKISNTLAMENLFSNVPTLGDPDLPPGGGSKLLKAFSEKVLRPRVPIVSQDCGTLLGKRMKASYSWVGQTSLNNLYQDRNPSLEPLISAGEVIQESHLQGQTSILKYYSDVFVRSVDSCVAVGPDQKKGLCQKCLFADAPYLWRIRLPSISNLLGDEGDDPLFWYLEDVRGGIRQTYLVYYAWEDDEVEPSEEDVSELSAVSGTPAEDIIFVRVDIAEGESPSANTVLALQEYGLWGASTSEDYLFIKPSFYQSPATTNAPYVNEVGSGGHIPGWECTTHPTGFPWGEVAKLSNLPTQGFYHRLARSYSGSLLGLAPVNPVNIPLREEVFYSLVSDNDIAVAYREMSSVLFGKLPTDLLRYIEDIPDRMEKALMIIATYTIYSYIG
jgi:hypothetical protein